MHILQKSVTFFFKSEANLRSNLSLFNKLIFFSLPVYVVLVPQLRLGKVKSLAF